MSKIKADASALPGELNDNWGSNYMMDGFWHDMDYENGMEESIGSHPVPQPSTSGFSHLPDGVLMGNDCEPVFHDLPDHIEREEEGAMDLAGLEIVASFDPSDASITGVVDHEWLGGAFQDPDRLPQSPTDDGIEELAEAWGDRTDGIRRIDMRDRIETQPNLGEQHGDALIQHRALVAMVQSAMRRSASGVSPKLIWEDLAKVLGPKQSRIAKPFKAIEAEHGLVGNVYVRASAYPGLQHGKWADLLKKVSTKARYLISASGEDCDTCAASYGMLVVAHPDEIDWNDAYATFAPGLEASGRLSRLATVGNKREALRAAFLRVGKTPRLQVSTPKPVHRMPADSVTSEEARRAFANRSTSPRQVVVDGRPAQLEQSRLVQRLGSMVKAHLISETEAKALCAAKGPPQARLKMAELLASRTKKVVYSGTTVSDPRVHISEAEFKNAQAGRHVAQSKTAAVSEESARRILLDRFFKLQATHASVLEKVHGLDNEVRQGLRGTHLRDRVAFLFPKQERELVASSLDPILVRGGYYDETSGSGRQFTGPILREATQVRVTKQTAPQEIVATVRWALQQMNEGFVGEDLDQLLTHRFSSPLLKAAATQLTQVRAKHEALAGHLYVDAQTYASSEGTKGCDAGGLRHRTNGIQHVLAMPRCGNCVYRNANDVCQKYNKLLVTKFDKNDRADFRRQVLASHRASDQEATAALFAPADVRSVVDPVSEFGLHNGSLDDVESSTPVHHGLDDVFFGGMEL